ncbi:MAG: bile acid:sodium symporter family protein [Candidatus Thiodiazotropha sp. (ex Lucina aurantia)]|nr:bile acid:sodium symporter family protein [Candidatus Thiodiazotropha sp. (ex Lucina pensylvanica)]MBT3025397.1 bile acid:sodium symporter family protein [Candidatus Thiodiazotropha taylori]MBT3056902.1 bile acid:sodium symporter family protein [Candidatus Thiodiazotropha sp. (ex Codakia orbicularis)]MBV2105239.1 bile acid:sodium symporter family protein [Candidatus Thiodiazotropha sp. (ex Lucina aurantia)]MBV2101118.1 bile acid:sodium symporter family protein [Candidatus Thiodiazotropha sp.
MNQDMILSLALPVTLFCIMFSMGTALVARDFRLIVESPFSVLIGIFSQMVILPIVALVVLMLLQLPPELFVGFMILAFSPGGTTSNMFSYLGRGNVALSITLTAIVSLVTPLTIPLFASQVIEWQLDSRSEIVLPFVSTFAKLVVVTLIPVALGMVLRHYRPNFCMKNERLLTRIPLIMLLLVIVGIIRQNWESMPLFIAQTGVPALILATLALGAGYGFARMMRLIETDARTVAIETGIQNGGTAILVTGTILNNPTMTIAPVMYGILMLIPTFTYIAWLNRRQTAMA